MSDLIDRKSAIDSIEKHLRFGDELYPLTETDKILNHAFEIAASCVYNLPSAQPEIVRCKDCAAYGEMLTGRDMRMICHKFALNFPRDFYCAYAERRTDE